MWRERERERERGYSNFRSRDKRSVLTRCSSNKQAESFSISSEKRGKRIQEPRAHRAALFSRLLYWESLAARITRGILPENTILHSKDRRTDALPLWIADSYGIRMNERGCWAPIYAYIHELSSASSRENLRKDPEKARRPSNSLLFLFSTNTIKRTIRDPFDKFRATDLSKRNSVQRNRYFSIYLYEAENFSSPMGRGSSLILVIFPLVPSREAVFELRR